MTLEIRASSRCFGGEVRYCSHPSTATGTEMRFSAYLPPGEGPFPVLLWLSGLTCTEDNFTSKAGAYRKAAELGLMVVAPDTSPRGEGVANDDSYDLGQGAGFYVDATEAPWSPHFRMESYVTQDLIAVVQQELPARKGPMAISGHSMGGHGALTLALNNPGLFTSVSAFAPIASPTRCPWGEKALGAYLGPRSEAWEQHDASLLIARDAASGHFDDILVDQGTADGFLEEQLKPELLEEAASKAGQKLTLRRQPGYDHSYFFISSFIDDHLSFHAQRLK
ncbi:S-formylglutathione hydrolase [Fodinicurvata sediminis]|uniref:S-formylglutathione hydrolase n=1 Tax=Fodinicurvata sediminis TaxID=1121832 RepID=UPI0003B63137|nr:S-formylglutathione hydrolase [Fodinicurvata sediminis]